MHSAPASNTLARVSSPSIAILRARWVIPIAAEPIENGAVAIQDGFIRSVGKFSEVAAAHPKGAVTDFGETFLLPGLINAHCHLDYTHMAGKIPRPANFPDWIKSILALKAHWSYSEYAASWVEGARQLLDSGTTTIADIEAAPELLPEVWNATPLRIISLLEMTGVRSADQPARLLKTTLDRIRKLPKSDRKNAGLSPHALYSTPPELLRLSANEAGLLAAIHVAESREEWQMYRDAAGPLFDWLKTQRDMSDSGGRSPVEQIARLGLLRPNVLLIHCNYLAPEDPARIANANASVVHCPRSHAYFGHDAFKYETLRDAGVNVCLGTDSMASVEIRRSRRATLSLWDELKTFSEKHSEVSAAERLRLVTINPARALNIPAGAIEPGRHADLISVEANSVEDLSRGDAKVHEVMIAGEWAGRLFDESNRMIKPL